MRVLLIIPTVSYPKTYPAYMSNSDFPVGFAYLASALREGGHEVAGLNPNNDAGYGSAFEMLSARIGRSLEECRPDMIGVGGLCTDFRFIVDAIQIIRERAPEVPIVCGGGIINNDAEFMFRTLRPDFCVIGEGEEILVRLADMIECGDAEYDRIPNIGYWDADIPRFTRQDFNYGDLDRRSFPDYAPFGIDEMLDDFSFAARYLYRYTRTEPRPMTIVAARSCPFKCTFCVHQRGTKYRARSVDNIIGEIKQLYERYSFNILIIVDELFAVDKARLREFCSALNEAKKHWGWDFDWLFQTHASADLDEATLSTAKGAGCYFFSYGLESASPKVLASMNKKISPRKIAAAIYVAGKVGIGFGGNFIFGDIAETPETIVETIEFFAAHCRDIHIYFADIKPYPGSKLFDFCVAKGTIKDRLRYYETIDRVLYNMTSMDDDTWLSMLRQVISLTSFNFTKCVTAHEVHKELVDSGYPRRVLGNKSVWHVQVRCPHCAQEVHYHEPVEDHSADGKDVIFVTGCASCNKRIRVNIPAATMTRVSQTSLQRQLQVECTSDLQAGRQTQRRSRMDVLFISVDFPKWRQARSWSYTVNLGFEEGFQANNIHFVTIPAMSGMSADTATQASFLGRIRDLCSGRRFDQVWVELVHSPLDENLLEYLSTLAPVRLGLLGESLQYTPDVYTMAPHLRNRCNLVESRLQYMTHALAVDEQDVANFNLRKLVKSMWWVGTVPERFINKQSGPLPMNPATFSGALYGTRSGWLGHPTLGNLLVRPAPLEDATPYPGLFDVLNSATFDVLRRGTEATETVLEDYLTRLRRIRKECFSLWLDGLRSGCAVVNLPSFLQAYASRVVEGMAAGRPVITWAVPDRPRNSALFKDGEEILMFSKDEPEILAQHITQLRKDRKLAEKIVLNARQRVLRFHTTEKRVGQILEWIETGCEPTYHDGGDGGSPRWHAADVALAGPRETDLARLLGDVDPRSPIMKWGGEGREMETVAIEENSRKASGRPEQPLVSVIIPTHNRPEMLASAIRSILEQTYPNLEIIVVNDAGKGVEEVVDGFNRTGRIAYVRHDRNRGLAAARNTGLRLARGKYIAYLDDDDRYYSDHLETLVTHLETSGRKVAYTDAHRATQQLEDGSYVTVNRDIPYSRDFDRDLFLITNYVPVLCFMHEKACLEKAGYFDETLTSHEDWDLWIRMSRKYDFVHIRKVTCEFSWRTDGSTMTSSRRSDYLRTMEIIYGKYRSMSKGKPAVLGAQARNLEHLMAEAGINGNSAGEPRSAPGCSIVIPVYNNLDFTRRCMEALAANTECGTPGSGYEVVIVDNASTDGTADFLRSLPGDVVTLRNGKNLGFAKACNQGARVARGRHIVFLNNDTVPRQGWLQALLAASKEEDAAICGARLIYPDGRIQHAGVAFGNDGIGYHVFNGIPLDHPAVSKRRRFQAVTAACMLVQRDVFEALGGFDEEYRNGFEDVDFCLRAGEGGHRIVYVPECVVVHHEGTTEGRKAYDRENLERFLARWQGKVDPDDDRIYAEEGFRKIVNSGGIRITLEPVQGDRHDSEDPASRGRVLKKEKRYNEATEALRQARSGGDLTVLADIGDCLAQEGKIEEAGSAYREAIKENPGDLRALAGLGVLDLVRGNTAGAAERFTSVLETDDRDATALCCMGLSRKAGGEAGEAFDWFMKALDADPVNATALHELVKTAHELGRLEEAERYLSAYLQYKPSDPHILFSLAGILFKSGKRDDALDTLDRLVFFEPSYVGADELRESIASSAHAV